MERAVFIQANKKQLLGAKIAKFAMETHGGAKKHSIPVHIMNVEEYPWYMEHVGETYARGPEVRTHTPKDLQFFTLSRFHPPKEMSYSGRAVVIDPDIFACADIENLFTLLPQEAAIGACKKKDAWDTSVMLLNCEKLKHWDAQKLIENLVGGKDNYRTWMQLQEEENVIEIPRTWNHLDTLTDETCMLHTTTRLTQPWKTGLPIDFTPGTPPKLFGIIPREPILKLRGKWPTHYLSHPDKNIESFILTLIKEALEANAITLEEIEEEIAAKNIREDMLTAIEKV